MSKVKLVKIFSSNKSPYQLFSSQNEYGRENIYFSKSTINPRYYLSDTKKKNNNFFQSRPFSSKTRDDREVTLTSKKLKSITLSNESYSNYINYYSSITQDHTFKKPRILNYPLRKNEQYIPITLQQNFINPTISDGDSIFLHFVKGSAKKNLEII